MWERVVRCLTHSQNRKPQLAAIIRGHGAIADRLHWVRDVVYDEDRSQVRTGNGPRVMASLRNLAIAILRLTGHASIAAALRYDAGRAAGPPDDHEVLNHSAGALDTHPCSGGALDSQTRLARACQPAAGSSRK